MCNIYKTHFVEYIFLSLSLNLNYLLKAIKYILTTHVDTDQNNKFVNIIL